MSTLEQRVASHFLTAALLQDKFVKAKKAELKSLLAKPAEKRPEDWAWQVQDILPGYFKRLHNDLLEVVHLPAAERYLQGKFERIQTYLEGLVSAHRRFGHPQVGEIDKDPLEYLKWYCVTDIHEAVGEKVKTLGDITKVEYVIDQPALSKLTTRFYAGLSKEDQDGILTSRKYAILAPSGLGQKALKCVKAVKLDLKLLEWFDTLIAGLVARFSEDNLQEQGDLQSFDLAGLKVVVQDPSLEPGDVKKYVAYFKQAHAALVSKGMAKVWRGILYLKPEGAGGVNHNTGGGTGGLYWVGGDIIESFVRPSGFLPEL